MKIDHFKLQMQSLGFIKKSKKIIKHLKHLSFFSAHLENFYWSCHEDRVIYSNKKPYS